MVAPIQCKNRSDVSAPSVGAEELQCVKPQDSYATVEPNNKLDDILKSMNPVMGILYYGENGEIKLGSLSSAEDCAAIERAIIVNSDRVLKEYGQPVFSEKIVDLDQARALRGKPQPDIVRSERVAQFSEPSPTTPPVETAKPAEPEASVPQSSGCGGFGPGGSSTGCSRIFSKDRFGPPLREMLPTWSLEALLLGGTTALLRRSMIGVATVVAITIDKSQGEIVYLGQRQRGIAVD